MSPTRRSHAGERTTLLAMEGETKATAHVMQVASPDPVSPVQVSALPGTEAINAPDPVGGDCRKIRVLVADDHEILRKGLIDLLEEQPELEVVGSAADGVEAVELALATQPDVIIMDITMPRLNGIEATRRITLELPQVRVIGLSMHEREDMATAMREAGAVAYLTKSGPSEDLIAAILRR